MPTVGLFVVQDTFTGDTVNEWVTAFDPDGHDGRGTVALSPDPAKALRFKSAAAATTFYRLASTIRPLRPDGKPNRPLTAFTVVVQPIPNVG